MFSFLRTLLSVSEMRVSILQRVLPGIPGLKLKQVKYCFIFSCPAILEAVLNFHDETSLILPVSPQAGFGLSTL